MLSSGGRNCVWAQVGRKSAQEIAPFYAHTAPPQPRFIKLAGLEQDATFADVNIYGTRCWPLTFLYYIV
jgi:hypothetical protein